MAVVYRFTCKTNGKVYVGKTVDLEQRLWKHRHAAKSRKNLPFYRAVRKYGWDGFSFEVVAELASVAEANELERRLIAETPRTLSYNVALGGDGGHTMSDAMIAQQYSIRPDQYEEFVSLFHGGLTARRIASHFGVAMNAVRRSARRIGVSFAARRAAAKKAAMARRERSAQRPPPKWTSEMESARRARGAAARARLADVQPKILALYFEAHLTAGEVATRLGVTRGTVRATVNAAYERMSAEEHAAMKRAHGSAVRTGIRNSNARLLRARSDRHSSGANDFELATL